MNQMTSSEKSMFLGELLRSMKLEEVSRTLLDYVACHEDYLTNLSFVDEANVTPNGIVVNLRKEATTQVAITYFEQGEKKGLSPEAIFQKLRLHGKETPFYIELIFDAMPASYAAIIETNPYSTMSNDISEEWKEEIDAFLDAIVKKTTNAMLRNQIDKALDERDEERFTRLTAKLS